MPQIVREVVSVCQIVKRLVKIAKDLHMKRSNIEVVFHDFHLQNEVLPLLPATRSNYPQELLLAWCKSDTKALRLPNPNQFVSGMARYARLLTRHRARTGSGPRPPADSPISCGDAYPHRSTINSPSALWCMSQRPCDKSPPQSNDVWMDRNWTKFN